jgi:hypothetical protein
VKLTSDVFVEYAKTAAISILDGIVEPDPDDGDHVVPGELRRFLADLRLLKGVPFSYLVPDADLLPPESIRFFYLDRNWTDAVVQGVLSVGTVTTTDRAQLETIYPTLRNEVDETERTVRTPQGAERLAGAGGTITGFLLRSRVVSGWPALHVRAYSVDELDDAELTTKAESHPSRMKLLRMERLAPAVLLVLIDGVPEVVHIEEPRQGVQFGARMDTDAPPTARTAEVHLKNSDTGTTLVPELSVPVPFRSGAPGVIDFRWLRDRMLDEDKTKTQLDDPMPTHQFALQMLRFPYRQVFGDPKNVESVKFYDLDAFHVTKNFKQWENELILKVQP